jgi:hypothetical protein
MVPLGQIALHDTNAFLYLLETKQLENIIIRMSSFSLMTGSFTYGVINQFLHIGWFPFQVMASKTLICPGLKVNASTLAAKRF